jgi:CRISPR-associated protein Csm4
MPADLTRVFSEATLKSRGKGLRHIRFFSEKLLAKALGGHRLDEDLFSENEQEEPIHGIGLQHGTLWLSIDEMPKLPESFRRDPGKRHAMSGLNVFSSGVVPRVTISRVTSATSIFQSGRVVFAQGCGLWFGVNWREPKVKVKDSDREYHQAFQQMLALLQDDGLGGERTTGYGAFKHKEEPPLTLGSDPQPGGLTFLLSRYHPRPDELPTALDPSLQTAYSLTGISGWLRSLDGAAQRRKKLFMVEEGSLVALPAFPAGDISNLRPDYASEAGILPHKVYRYGLAFGLAWPGSTN